MANAPAPGANRIKKPNSAESTPINSKSHSVTDGEGKRNSLDVNADSSYDAAHLYVAHVRGNPGCGFPIPTTSTLFEVVTAGRIHHVRGMRLRKWIENRRQEWQGPRGLLFSQRPMIGD